VRVSRRQPEGPPPPPIVQRIRLQYAKRGRLRFSSHRDFARAFERSLRRAEIPMAYSAGFHPHPKISYVGAAPTGVGSEAEYCEIALARRSDPEWVRAAIDAVLPDGLDIVAAADVEDCLAGSLTELIQGSLWRLEFHDPVAPLAAAVQALLAADEVLVERLTKDGTRSIDARGAIVRASVHAESAEPGQSGDQAGSQSGTAPAAVTGITAEPTGQQSGLAPGPDRDAPGAEPPSVLGRAILEVVVRQVTPTVRPDDVLSALRSVAGFAPSRPPRATRLAQGPVDDAGVVGSPLSKVELSDSS
jgi:radical SAM-linked protein